jgi:cell division protein FtsB
MLLWWSHVAGDSRARDVRRDARRGILAARPGGRAKLILKVVFVFVVALVIVDALVGDRGLLALLRARRQYDTLAATIAHQRAENARLRELARRLTEDPTAIEEVARRELGLIKPGEKVFIIKGLTSPPEQDRPAPLPGR